MVRTIQPMLRELKGMALAFSFADGPNPEGAVGTDEGARST